MKKVTFYLFVNLYFYKLNAQTLLEMEITIPNGNPFIHKILKYKPFYEYVITESIRKFQFCISEKDDLLNLSKINVINKFKNNEIYNYSFLPVGIQKDNIFTWLDSVNETVKIYQFVEDGFVSEEILNYFFTTNVELTEENNNFIPCFISITNPSFNLIRFKFADENILYALIPLGINDKFDFSNFLNF